MSCLHLGFCRISLHSLQIFNQDFWLFFPLPSVLMHVCENLFGCLYCPAHFAFRGSIGFDSVGPRR